MDSYELREAGEVRGTCCDKEIAFGDRRWEIGIRRHGFGWIAVAERMPNALPEAAWYPAWRPGGTLCFEHADYRLFQHPLTGRWRLREVGGNTVATLVRKDRWTGLDIVLESPACAMDDIWLLVLFASWPVMREVPYVVMAS